MKIEYVNDLSIYKQIVDNSRNPLESIREFISNSWDVKATEIEISIFYNYETNKIDMIFKNNGQGLDIEEISKLILGAGHSTKTIKDESIGNKGIGTLLYLK
ncbi:Histidine kinase-, DNA gyrase B-, and HSP90-like ATPase [Terrisporobacter glycolicus]|nr:Histidine kinase-, DNA gyrase B-, and HSP90-like ATPase [Terrisporobacter glycolicus]